MNLNTRTRITLIVVGISFLGLGLWLQGSILENGVSTPEEAFAHGEIRIGIDGSYPPFAIDINSELTGIDIELGKALAQHLNMPVRFINMGFDGLYDALISDRVDLLIAALIYDPARTRDVLYTQPYYDNGLVLLSNPERGILSPERLAGHKLALEYGSSADSMAQRWLRRFEPFKILPYERPLYALASLRLGQADAALVDATSYFIYQREQQNWRVTFQYVTHAPYVMAVHIDKQDTLKLVNQALSELKKTGIVDAILQQWLGTAASFAESD